MKKKNMSALKKIIAAVLAVAVLVGGIFAARTIIDRNRSVGVMQVMQIADTWIQENTAGYGQVSQGGVQQVWPESGMLITKVYVSEGDHVSRGDPLVQYDLTQAKLQADACRIEYEMAKRDLSEAQKRLEYIRTFRPNQKPEPDRKIFEEPVDLEVIWDEDGVNWTLNVLSGKDSVKEILDGETRKIIIDVNLDTPITRGTFEALLHYDPDAVLPSPEQEPEEPQPEPGEAQEPSQDGQQEDEPAPDEPGKKEVLPQMDFCFRIWAYCEDMDSVHFASVSTRPDEDGVARKRWIETVFKETDEEGQQFEVPYMFSSDYAVDEFTGAIDEHIGELEKELFTFVRERANAQVPETERYSQSEIDRMILEQNALIREKKIDVAQAELDWRQAKQSSGDGVVRAAHDGVVVSYNPPSSGKTDEPMLQVSSGDGYQIISTINELQLTEVSVGDKINIMMWSNGQTYEGTIIKISPYPTQNSMSYSSQANLSNYQYTAELDCQDELQPWDGGEVSFPKEGEGVTDSFALQTCFVRQEGGRSYVLAADEDGRLYKKFIQTGRILYGGWSVEVTGGLSLEDYIAFPYGKNAVEGAKADMEAEVMAW